MPGFLAIQLISETVEIINKILEGHSEDDNVSFAMQEVQSITDLESPSPEDNCFFPIRKMKSTMSSEHQGSNIMTLLTFLFDCLRQEFSDCFDDESMDQIKLHSTVGKVVNWLLDTCDQDPDQIHKKIKFLCSFLEQLEFEDVLLDTPDKLSNNADLFK